MKARRPGPRSPVHVVALVFILLACLIAALALYRLLMAVLEDSAVVTMLILMLAVVLLPALRHRAT